MSTDNYAYVGGDNNPSGFTNNFLEARKAIHFFDQAYSDFALYDEHRGSQAKGPYDTIYNNSHRDIVKAQTERNPISDMFFAHANMKHLKMLICKSIYQRSGGKYNPTAEAQSDNELLIVMRSMYTVHARHAPEDIRGQVGELNRLVMDDMVPRAISSAQLHLSFIRDSTQQPLPMDRPLNISSAGTRGGYDTTKFI